MRIALIGANVDALLLALKLDDQGHDVTVIEIEAEIGLPVDAPGRAIDRALLNQYFSQPQQAFLALKENQQGWGCRWEWVIKHLSHAVAHRSISCYTRTRILKMEPFDAGHCLHVQSTERSLPTELTVDHVILVREAGDRSPGRRQHQLSDAVHRFHQTPMALWSGGLVVVADTVTNPPDASLVLERADGLAELWWDLPSEWTPARGFIETYRSWLPSDLQELSFDAAVHRVASFELPTPRIA
jgi:hypothetical protein